MSEFKLKSQMFLRAGETAEIDLDMDDELVFPENLRGKIEVHCVVSMGFDRLVTVVALENIFFDPCDLVITDDDRMFDHYRDELEEFLDYRSELEERLTT